MVIIKTAKKAPILAPSLFSGLPVIRTIVKTVSELTEVSTISLIDALLLIYNL